MTDEVTDLLLEDAVATDVSRAIGMAVTIRVQTTGSTMSTVVDTEVAPVDISVHGAIDDAISETEWDGR